MRIMSSSASSCNCNTASLKSEYWQRRACRVSRRDKPRLYLCRRRARDLTRAFSFRFTPLILISNPYSLPFRGLQNVLDWVRNTSQATLPLKGR